MDLVSFDILGVDAVVADVRIRECHDLLAIAGVGEDFLVAGDGGVEHHFADGGAGGTNRIADKDRAVCERQDGGGNFPCRDKSTGFSGWLRSPGACRPLAQRMPAAALRWVVALGAIGRRCCEKSP
jgi:hypothetical protein